MKTYNERTRDILQKLQVKKQAIRRRNRIIAASVCCMALIFSLMLFIPYDTNPVKLSEYAGNEYYALIESLTPLTYAPPVYKNNFEKWTNEFTQTGMDLLYAGGSKDAVNAMPEAAPDHSYQEITDNQVSGVVEADRIKRSDRYLYFLRDETLHIYSIEGENSKQVGSFPIANNDHYQFGIYANNWEMYLSQDCKTVTLLMSCRSKDTGKRHICVLNLDVSDPANIREISRVYFGGSYLSSRLTDGKLLLMYRFYVDQQPDFSNEKEFVPQYGTPENMHSIPMDNIVIPDDPGAASYTVVCTMDDNTLTVLDTAAFLSYSEDVYVSEEAIYLTRSYSEQTVSGDITVSTVMTQISCVRYGGDELRHIGTIDVAGSINNQYNLDEHNGILRIVTDTAATTYQEKIQGEHAYSSIVNRTNNANLYCFDLDEWEMAATVESFAPEGEDVKSVRYDGDYAYVCTAITYQEILTDPVFFFDLRDLENITWKDTGTITGYSMSLVDFCDGYLLGIGYGDDLDTLKIEVYRENATAVESACKYVVKNADFSEEYKSYLIDRNNQFIGLMVYTFENNQNNYTLLGFDGYELFEIASVPLSGDLLNSRGVYIDGFLYLLGDEFKVVNID